MCNTNAAVVTTASVFLSCFLNSLISTQACLLGNYQQRSSSSVIVGLVWGLPALLFLLLYSQHLVLCWEYNFITQFMVCHPHTESCILHIVRGACSFHDSVL